MNHKVSQQINDIVGDNIKKLAQIFPSVVKDGEVDFEALKEELGDFQEVGSEKYEFTWVGKQDAKKLAQEDVVGRTLKFIPEDSKDADTTENLYIEGDNLEVLKLLRQNYYGAIKMIYIDPPYNTGNDFLYNDSFKINKNNSDILEGNKNEDGERYVINKVSHNRFHAKWLNMIYPRLQLARELLTDTGAIFISIDDHESDNVKKICNEIFGEKNFVACVTWQRNYAPISLKKYFSESHEYCFIYAKNIDSFQMNLLPRSDKQNKDYKNPDNDPRGVWKVGNLTVGPAVEKQIYEIIGPTGKKFMPPSGYCWRFTKEKFEEMRKDNRIWFGLDGNNSPVPKLFLTEVQNGVTPMTLWTFDEAGHNQIATRELRDLFNGAVFTSPKPVKYLTRFLQIGMNKEDIVLDFFSGSSTTAHAVMELNAKDNGNRKYIMVQLNELCDKKSISFKNGYRSICDIGKERIRRAGEKIKKEYKKVDIDIGFKVFKTSDTNIKWNTLMNFGQMDMKQIEISPDTVDFVPETKDIDVVYELMLRQKDVPLSSKIEKIFGGGYSRTYLYADSYLVCLETKITEKLIDKLARIDPLPIKFIFRDSAFQDDIALKDETFRRLKALIEKNNGMKKMTYTVEFL
ncbi:MAG: site-specific DNA-methyltransferase [Anaerostipes hadrus]|jgi:adenine-specific DNA-methyltransferase|nr:MAG: site-specific DNA-methyltransferase [Anaerostipes hadrus]